MSTVTVKDAINSLQSILDNHGDLPLYRVMAYPLERPVEGSLFQVSHETNETGKQLNERLFGIPIEYPKRVRIW